MSGLSSSLGSPTQIRHMLLSLGRSNFDEHRLSTFFFCSSFVHGFFFLFFIFWVALGVVYELSSSVHAILFLFFFFFLFFARDGRLIFLKPGSSVFYRQP